jgi:hypothetical protein
MRALLAIAVIAFASPAFADNKSEAEALFKKAKKLHADKKYSEACPMFEKSDSLDSGIGAKLNVAKCYEDWGMLARAHRWYTDAHQMALDAQDKRAEKIKELLDAVDGDVPRLTVKLPEDIDTAKADLKLDGKSIDPGKELRVDPGPHEITWMVEGKKRSKTIPMERGGERELTLDARAVVTTPEGKTVIVPAKKIDKGEPESPGRTRRIIGISVGAAGIVGLGIAGVLTLGAKSDYNDALDKFCMGEKNMCNDDGLKATSDARSKANVATVITIVSLAAIGGGVVLYLTAPKGSAKKESKTVYVTPLVTHDTGGIVIGGGF